MKKVGNINNIPIVQGKTNEIKNQIKADIDNNGKISLSKRTDNGIMENINQGITPQSILEYSYNSVQDINISYTMGNNINCKIIIYLKNGSENPEDWTNVSSKCIISTEDSHPRYPNYYSEDEDCFYISFQSSSTNVYVIYNNILIEKNMSIA